jgi:hypothetical protein
MRAPFPAATLALLLVLAGSRAFAQARVFWDEGAGSSIDCRAWTDRTAGLCGIVDGTYTAPRYTFVRVAPGDAVRVDVYNHEAHTMSGWWVSELAVVDGFVSIPISVDGPMEFQRISVWLRTAATISQPIQFGAGDPPRQLLPATRVYRLPRWASR